MPAKKTIPAPSSSASAKLKPRRARATKADAPAVLAWIEENGSGETRAGMARYGIPSDHAYGVPVGALRQYAKRLGRSHELAAALWDSGVYEARMLAAFVDEPTQVTTSQMDAWCRVFDNWALVDTACFALFDRTPHAWSRVDAWAGWRGEQQKRAAFALLACLALHDKAASDDAFSRRLPLVQRAASDGRNFVKKGVSWALRAIGERNRALHERALEVANHLADSAERAPRWVGEDAKKKLESAAVKKRIASRGR